MAGWMVVVEDAHGCHFGEPAYFDTKAEAVEHGDQPIELSPGHAVMLYRLVQEETLQEHVPST